MRQACSAVQAQPDLLQLLLPLCACRTKFDVRIGRFQFLESPPCSARHAEPELLPPLYDNRQTT